MAKVPRKKAPSPAAQLSPDSAWRLGWLLPLLIIAVGLAYQPAWHGQMLWDDDAHLTRPELRSAVGLWRIWFELGATQQYYPVVHSLFWLQSKLWADSYTGYHLVNIALHASSAYLLALILRRLQVRGAILASFIFALHPVHAETVAWMTELKNTASGVFYLAAALIYLRFDERRSARTYIIALLLFVLALLSKSVTASLPAAILIILWWQRGRLEWQRDVRPLVPFFALGAIAGLTTAWVERTYVGARGSEFELSALERCLVAGRALVFYAGKLLWPVHLVFIYPRWQVDPSSARQYVYPGVAIAALLALWALRHRTRAPLAAVLFFIVTLAPALGFVNVYPFRYSFVADHFQYLASIGIITLAAAGIVTAARRWGNAALAEALAIAVIGVPLWAATHAQSRRYIDDQTLFARTLERNPECWLAHNRLGVAALSRPDGTSIAIEHLQTSLRIKPEEPLTHDVLGTAYARIGRNEAALAEHRRAVELAPGFAEAYGDMGGDLQNLGRLNEAAEAYRTALAIKPDLTYARVNLGVVLELQHRPTEAAAELARAQQTASAGARDDFDNVMHLGAAYLTGGRFDDAAAQFQRAVAANPSSTAARLSLGEALARAGRTDEAVRQLSEAVRRNPGDAAAHADLATALHRAGRIQDAITEYDKAFTIGSVPLAAERHNDAGVALAQLGRRDEAVRHFEEAVRLKPDFGAARANLARAQAMRR